MLHCLDSKQAWDDHRLSEAKNDDRLAVIIRAAGVDMDFNWDYCVKPTNPIAKIIDHGNLDLPAIEIFANDREYDASDACNLATGTG